MELPKTFEELLSLAPQKVKDLIEGLKDLRERPDYHPEPNAREHVKIVTERLILTGDPDLIMSGLFHDITKKLDAKINPKTGWPTSPGHDRGGARIAREHSDFVQSMGANIDNVFEICEQHMRVKQINDMRPKKQEALKNLPTWKKLEIFTLADNMLSEFSV